MKKIKIKTYLLLTLIFSLLTGSYLYTASEIPDSYYTVEGESLHIETLCPTTAEISSETDAGYSLNVKYLGLIPVKTVSVQIVKPQSVVPGGQSFGLRLYSDGVLVVSVDSASPAAEAGVSVGDIIKTIDGKTVSTNNDVSAAVHASEGKEIRIELTHDGKEKNVSVKPKEADGRWKIGLWVRDSISGIGTITYFDTQNTRFAALGHSISDSETGVTIPLLSGQAFHASISGVAKGKPGTPGELKGIFLENERIGQLYKNIGEGVFGVTDPEYTVQGTPVEIAYKQDVHVGDATILSTVDGNEVKAYSIRIERVSLNSAQTTKNMLIRVTDKELINTTGGIVQGMSGSPILQDGKIIGAVTHVLVSSPETGYGIFIENMIDRE